MLDIKFIRENPDAVKENIKKKFQDVYKRQPPCSPTGAIRAERQNHPLITEGRPPPAAAGLAV